MMKKSVIVTSLVFVSIFGYGQESYFRFNVGYGTPFASQQISDETTIRSSTGKTKGIYGSYGKGVYFEGAYGLISKGPLGFDLEFSYLLGDSYNGTYLMDGSGGSYYEESVTSAKGFFVAPSITFTTRGKEIQGYARLGPILGSNTITNEINGKGGLDKLYLEVDYKGGISMGWKSSLGINFNASNRIVVFSELSVVAMTYYPKIGEVTKILLNDKSAPTFLPAAQRDFEFKEEITFSTTSTANYDRLKKAYPFGSIALDIGLKINLNKSVDKINGESNGD